MKENEKKPFYTAVVLAAGSGSRMQSAQKKQFMDLCGRPMVVYSLEAFEQNPNIDSIVLVVAKEDMQYAINLCMLYQLRKVKNIAEGGSARFRSVYNGVKAAPQETDYILIHDGARPLVSQALIDRCCTSVTLTRALVAAVPVKDTIKTGDTRGFALQTLDRSNLWSIQTPQAFSYRLFLSAYEKLFQTIAEYHPDESKLTDDAVIVENMTDCSVRLLHGDYRNIKVTTPDDLIIAEALLKAQAEDENDDDGKE